MSSLQEKFDKADELLGRLKLLMRWFNGDSRDSVSPDVIGRLQHEREIDERIKQEREEELNQWRKRGRK